MTKDIPALTPLIEKVSAQKAAELTAANTAARGLRQLRVASAARIALGIVEIADLLAIGQDTSSGNSANVFAATSFKPEVLLSLASGTYYANQKVIFTAAIQNKAGITLLYRWKYSGSNLVVFDDGKVYDKLEFDSTSSFVTLTPSPSNQGSVTVSVEAFDTTGGARTSLGGANDPNANGTASRYCGNRFSTISDGADDKSERRFLRCIKPWRLCRRLVPAKFPDFGYLFAQRDAAGRIIQALELGVYDLNFFNIKQPAPGYPHAFDTDQIQALYTGTTDTVAVGS